MIQAMVVCTTKVRVGASGRIRIRFEAVDGALPNRRWSDGEAELHFDIITTREAAREFDVLETYVLDLGIPE